MAGFLKPIKCTNFNPTSENYAPMRGPSVSFFGGCEGYFMNQGWPTKKYINY